MIDCRAERAGRRGIHPQTQHPHKYTVAHCPCMSACRLPGGGGFRAYESTNSGATKSVPLLKNERRYVWFPIFAHEKHRALAMPNVYLHKSLKTLNKLRTKISYRIWIAEILACTPPPPWYKQLEEDL